MRHLPRTLLVALSTALLSVALAACGGGGGGGGGTPGVAPSNLAYSSPGPVYRTDTAIAPNVPSYSGGTPTLFTIQPALATGLLLDPSSGVISGSPLAPSGPTVHTVTASNAAGSDQALVTIAVLWHESKSLAVKSPLSDDDLRHFLNRTHFGFSQAHYDALLANGLPAYVDAMTTITAAQTQQLEADATTAYLEDPAFPSAAGLARWWLYLMLLNPNPFQECLALHWHDHFATSQDVLDEAARYWFLPHMNLLRHGAAGNLRTLLLALARDWAMLEWLDGIRNNGSSPQLVNENFSREWFELFCLGVDVLYTQTDIVEAARAFSGYRSRFNSGTGQLYVQFDPTRHDPNNKTVLGVLIPGQNVTDDYQAMVDITLGARAPGTNVSACGRWIVRSLLRSFCYEDPPQNVVDELALLLEQGNWELKPVLVVLFQSEAFFSALARVGFSKPPTHLALGFIRSTNLIGDPRALDTAFTLMGHRATMPPVVDGWPEGPAWYHAQGMVDRANVFDYLTVGAKPIQDAFLISAAQLLPSPTATAGEVVDALALRLRIALSAEERTELIAYLNTTRTTAGATIPDPFDASNLAATETKLRGLLWIMAQHPNYQVR